MTHPTFKVQYLTIPWDPNNPEKLHGDSGSNVSAGSFFSRSFWSFRNLQVAIIVAARHAEFTHIADTCWTANRAVGCYYLMAIDWGILPGFWAEMELSQQKKSKNIDMWYIIFKGIIKYITSTIQIPTPVPVKRTWIWGLDQCCNWIIQIFKGCLPFSSIHLSCSAGKKKRGSTTSTFQHDTDTLIRSAHLTILDGKLSAQRVLGAVSPPSASGIVEVIPI